MITKCFFIPSLLLLTEVFLIIPPLSAGYYNAQELDQYAAKDIISPQEFKAELKEKHQRVLDFLKNNKLKGVLLTTVANFAWITGGADSHIVITSEGGCASLFLLDNGEKYLIVDNIESKRLQEEQLKGLGFKVKEYRWHKDIVEPQEKTKIIKELTNEGDFASDVPFPGARMMAKEISRLRYQLTDSEIKKYHWLGKEAAAAVDRVCRSIKPGMSERQIEAMTSNELMKSGIRPTVILIGTDNRILSYRHNPPTDAKLKKYAMVNICARRWGLVIALTRFVYFGKFPEELRNKLKATVTVDATIIHNTRPGVTADELFACAAKAYDLVGFPGQEQKHHQGGAIGYAEREWFAVPGSMEKVLNKQAFAWNPTIEGTKSEDTIIVLDDNVEVITEIAGWPMIEVEVEGTKYLRPDILIKE
jgi:Xaa-Pro dipeptidase